MGYLMHELAEIETIPGYSHTHTCKKKKRIGISSHIHRRRDVAISPLQAGTGGERGAASTASSGSATLGAGCPGPAGGRQPLTSTPVHTHPEARPSPPHAGAPRPLPSRTNSHTHKLPPANPRTRTPAPSLSHALPHTHPLTLTLPHTPTP